MTDELLDASLRTIDIGRAEIRPTIPVLPMLTLFSPG
jgi:hypothetical protein